MHQIIKEWFLALQGGNEAFKSFLGKCSTLYESIKNTNPSSLEEDSDIHALYQSASVISQGASEILQLQQDTARIGNEALAEFVAIIDADMGKLSIDDKQNSRYVKGPVSSSTPEYVKPAYEWLLANLHNPYPSKEVKKEISRQTHSPVKDIDAWFIDARKRIGWNKLRKTKFSNKQESIIAAATHFFKPKPIGFSDDTYATFTSRENPNDAYRLDFAAIQNLAKRMYAHKFPDLAPLFPFDHHVEHFAETTHPGGHCSQTPLASRSFPHRTSNHYPTPEPSPGQMSEESSPTFTDKPLPENVQIGSRKRRQSSSVSGGPEDPPRKRLRSTTDTSSDTCATIDLPSTFETKLSDSTCQDCSLILPRISFPSPPPEIDSFENADSNGSPSDLVLKIPYTSGPSSVKRKRDLSDCESPGSTKHQRMSLTTKVDTTETLAVSAASQLPRKRRLSDSENQRAPKRPHNALVIPRLQTVSNPFPTTKLPSQGSFEPSPHGDDSLEKDFSETISPVCMGDLFSINPLLEGCHAPTYLPSPPDEATSYCMGASEEPLNPDYDTPVIFSDLINPSLHLDPLQDFSPNLVVSTATFPYIDDLLLGSTFDSCLQTQSAFIEQDSLPWFASTMLPDSISHPNVNYDTYKDSVDAKKAKLQALKEQVFQLESQLAE